MSEETTAPVQSFGSLPADVKMSLRMVASPINGMVLFGADVAAEHLAPMAGFEATRREIDPKLERDYRKQLDEALARVIHHYMPGMGGPIFAYLFTLSNAMQMYSIKRLPEPEGQADGESLPGATAGEAAARQDD